LSVETSWFVAPSTGICGSPHCDGWLTECLYQERSHAGYSFCLFETASELAREYASTEALAAHPKIARFVEWIARQPPTADISVRRKRA
jgi:hypothetical protein